MFFETDPDKQRRRRGIRRARRAERRLQNIRRRNASEGLAFFPKQRSSRVDRFKEIMLWVLHTVVAVSLAVILVLSFGLRLRVPGDSMEDTLGAGQHVLIDRVAYRLSTVERYDVIAFYPAGNKEAQPSVKRIVGMPGESVRIENGLLLINGVPDVRNGRYDLMEDAGIAYRDIRLKENEYFVIGDNRNHSEDSRSASVGNVTGESIIGKIWFAFPGSGGNFGFVD